MPHPVTCGACNATFSIPDEVWDRRVLGQLATLKCRQCKSPIEVDGRHRKGATAVNPAPVAAEPAVAQPEPSPAALAPPAPRTEEPLEPKQPDATPSAGLASTEQVAKLNKQAPASAAVNGNAAGEEAKKWETAPATHASPVSVMASGSPSLAYRKGPDRSPTRPALPSNISPKAVLDPTTKSKPGAPHRAESKSSPSLSDAEKRRDSVDIWVVSFGEDDDRELGTSQLAETISKGLVTRETIVWREGMGDWLPIGTIPELAGYLKQEIAASKQAPIVPSDDGDDQTVIYRPADKVATSAISSARNLTANVASPVMGKGTTSTLAKSDTNAARASSPDAAAGTVQRNLIPESPTRVASHSSPTPTGVARRGDVPARMAGDTASKLEASPGSPAAPAVTPGTAPVTKPGGPPPLRRAQQPSRPEVVATSAKPWSAETHAQTTSEVVTSVPGLELAQTPATPPPLPVKDKPFVAENPTPRPAVFPPPAQPQQPYPSALEAGPLRMPATPSFAPRPSDIAAPVSY